MTRTPIATATAAPTHTAAATVIPAPPIPADVRASRARVPLTPLTGPLGKLLTWYATRAYGQVPDNGLVLASNRPVLLAIGAFERRVAKWRAADEDLKVLAAMAAAASIGCSWCLDFGFYAAHAKGLDTSKLSEVPRWRESDVFDDRERRVLEYAEAMTATPPEVTDAMTEALRADLGDAALVELTMMVAVENERSRFNAALGLVSQGFSESCRVPAGGSGRQR